MNYYPRFVPGFPQLVAPLTDLLHKDVAWEWTTVCQEAFKDLKQELITQPIMLYPDFRMSFWLYTDASSLGLGAILALVQDHLERIISCASRTTNSSEKNYGPTKLECLAMI